MIRFYENTIISNNRENKKIKKFLIYFRQHVHAHSVAGGSSEPNEQVSTGYTHQRFCQPCKLAGRVERGFDHLEIIRVVYPKFCITDLMKKKNIYTKIFVIFRNSIVFTVQKIIKIAHTHLAVAIEENLTTGPLVMPSSSILVVTPPLIVNALHPRFVLATRHPSVVAMGT